MQADAFADVIKLAVQTAVAPLIARLQVVEGHAAFISGAITPLAERLAALESRPPVPGPAGPAGEPGVNGLNGKDGAPGKDGVAGLRYCGVFQNGALYEQGDIVTWAGSAWHCHAKTNTKPGDGSASWQLMVKRGRDGRDDRGAAA